MFYEEGFVLMLKQENYLFYCKNYLNNRNSTGHYELQNDSHLPHRTISMTQ